MSEKVVKYIKDNWASTIRQPDAAVHGMVKLLKPFSVPCADELFVDFYYWDTYFINLGLLRSGREDQVENNLDNMRFFIENLGYVPNANHLLDRSQPPFFCRAVYDLYKAKNDRSVIDKYIGAVLREHEFFELDRTGRTGLSTYRNNCTRQALKESYPWLCDRVGIVPDSEEAGISVANELYAIAESGWDFTPRFRTGTSLFAALEHANIDLNSLLYDAEIKAAEMLEVIDRKADAAAMRLRAAKRKEKMCELMFDPADGVPYDYNYVSGTLSKTLSSASFYPFAMGISTNKEALKQVLSRLELNHGVSACEYRGPDDIYLQWDYPAVWPSNTYFAVYALQQLGLNEDARRIAQKYVGLVDRVFEKTGRIWEKYDGVKGDVSVTMEYATPHMLGWSAGVYLWLLEQLGETGSC